MLFSTHKHTGPSMGRTKVNMCQCCLASNLSPQYEAFQHPGQLPDGSCPPLPSLHPHTECRWPLLSWPSSLNTCISCLVCNQQNSCYLFFLFAVFCRLPIPHSTPSRPICQDQSQRLWSNKGLHKVRDPPLSFSKQSSSVTVVPGGPSSQMLLSESQS